MNVNISPDINKEEMTALIRTLQPRIDRTRENIHAQAPIVLHQGQPMRQGPLVFNGLSGNIVCFSRWLNPVGQSDPKPIEEQHHYTVQQTVAAAHELAKTPKTLVPQALVHALNRIQLEKIKI
jgi:hypothetical protein